MLLLRSGALTVTPHFGDVMLSHLAKLLAFRALLAGASRLPTDANARNGFEQAAAWVFQMSERLVGYAVAVGGRPKTPPPGARPGGETGRST